MAQGMTENDLHISPEFLKAVLDGHALGNPSMLALRDPEAFVAGNLHGYLPVWERISKCAPDALTSKILHWIRNCVDIRECFQSFKGRYKGEGLESVFPPPNTFCFPFEVLSVLGFSLGDFLLRLGAFYALSIL